MSAEPLGPRRKEFPQGIKEVYANFYFKPAAYINWLQVKILNYTLLPEFDSGPMTPPDSPGWVSVKWSVSDGIPSVGSPYYTELGIINRDNLYELRKQSEFYVGVGVRFDLSDYYGTAQPALVTVNDPGANPDNLIDFTALVTVTSSVDAQGLQMHLPITDRARGRYSTRLYFCTTCDSSSSDPDRPTLKVADGASITAAYRSAEGFYQGDATWHASFPEATPTFEWATGTPLPTRTPTATHTPPPHPIIIAMTPAPEAIGYIVASSPNSNYFGRNFSVFAGSTGSGNILEGAFQFVAPGTFPPGARIFRAGIDLIGKDAALVGPTGTWRLNLLAPGIDENWKSRTYADIHGSAIDTTLLPLLGPGDLYAGQKYHFEFSPADLSVVENRWAATGKFSFRMDGPLPDSNRLFNVFSWYSGNETDRPQITPPAVKMEIGYTLNQASSTPVSTSTLPPSSTPSRTPTPSPTQTDTLTPWPTLTPTPTPSPTPTLTWTPTQTSTPTPTPTTAVFFDRNEYYTEQDQAIIAVVGPQPGVNSVLVQSESDPAGIWLTLSESIPGRRTATLRFSLLFSDQATGTIRVANGNRLRAQYAGYFSPSATWFAQAPTPTATPSPTSTPMLIYFDKNLGPDPTYYGTHETAIINVIDPFRGPDTLQVTVSSSKGDPFGIVVTLARIAPDSVIFSTNAHYDDQGQPRNLRFTTDANSNESQVLLKVHDSDQIKAVYPSYPGVEAIAYWRAAPPSTTPAPTSTPTASLTLTLEPTLTATSVPSATPTPPGPPTRAPTRTATPTASSGSLRRIYLPLLSLSAIEVGPPDVKAALDAEF